MARRRSSHSNPALGGTRRYSQLLWRGEGKGHRRSRARSDGERARTDHSPALFISFQPASKTPLLTGSRLPAPSTSVASWLTAWAYRLFTPSAAPHPRHPAARNHGRRSTDRRNSGPPRPGLGSRLHENHRPTPPRSLRTNATTRAMKALHSGGFIYRLKKIEFRWGL
jgi:hypothetical protein